MYTTEFMSWSKNKKQKKKKKKKGMHLIGG